MLSPFSLDSSTLKLPLISLPSAGNKSPLSSITKSPTTTSSKGISITLPFLFTLTFTLSLSSCNLLNVSSLPYSLIVEIKEESKIAIKIPIVSNQSKSLNKKNILITNASIKILIIGSPKDSSNNPKNVFLLISVNLLDPLTFLDISTSLLVSPVLIIQSIT